jgi:hypothetical protein
MLVCHGRMPFAGPRKILVAMGEPMEEPVHANTNARVALQAEDENGGAAIDLS